MSIVISALIRRRREIACDLARLQSDINAIDRVLCLFDPTLQPDQIPALAFYKRKGWAARGEISRLMIDILRKAGSPLTSVQITDRVMEAMDDGNSRVKHAKRVQKALERQRINGAVIADRSGAMILWRLADQAARCQ